MQLYSATHKNVFEGDVLSLYGPTQNKSLNSPNKAQLMHVNLVDKDGQFTIIVNMSDNHISHFIDYFSLGSTVQILNFETRNKGQYDWGNAKYCI